MKRTQNLLSALLSIRLRTHGLESELCVFYTESFAVNYTAALTFKKKDYCEVGSRSSEKLGPRFAS